MSSAALWDALAAFLAHDTNAGSVRVAVNAEQTNALAEGSVYVARRAQGAAARRVNALPLAVELVLADRRERVVGIGGAEVDLTVALSIKLRRKSTSPGATQVDVVEDVARALVRRYQLATNLGITVAGATFLRSTAEVEELDAEPDEGELQAASVRAVFTFLEPLGANT